MEQHAYQIITQDFIDYLVVNEGESVIDAFNLYKQDESGQHMADQELMDFIQIN